MTFGISSDFDQFLSCLSRSTSPYHNRHIRIVVAQYQAKAVGTKAYSLLGFPLSSDSCGRRLLFFIIQNFWFNCKNDCANHVILGCHSRFSGAMPPQLSENRNSMCCSSLTTPLIIIWWIFLSSAACILPSDFAYTDWQHTKFPKSWDCRAADKAAIQRVRVPPCQLPDSGT